MKYIVKFILETIGFLTSLVFPSFIYNALIDIKSHLYTGYRRKDFMHFGKRSLMASTVKLVNPKYIYVGNECEFFHNVKLSVTKNKNTQKILPQIMIGNRCQFGELTHITSVNSIKIGDNLLTGSNVLISDNAHGESKAELLKLNPQDRPLYSKGGVVIGNNVWLCNNVCVLPGVTIGNGVIVAANSIVTHNIPNNCVAAGIPAKIIKVMK